MVLKLNWPGLEGRDLGSLLLVRKQGSLILELKSDVLIAAERFRHEVKYLERNSDSYPFATQTSTLCSKLAQMAR